MKSRRFSTHSMPEPGDRKFAAHGMTFRASDVDEWTACDGALIFELVTKCGQLYAPRVLCAKTFSLLAGRPPCQLPEAAMFLKRQRETLEARP